MKFFRSVPRPDTKPEPQVHNHHHNQPDWVWIVVVSGVLLLSTLYLLYSWLLSLLAAIGARNPEAMFALLFWGAAIGTPMVLFINKIVSDHIEARHRRTLELEELLTERLQIQHRLMTSVNDDTNTTDPEEKRRNALIVALVADMLQGKDNFSYRKAGAYMLANENEPLGKDSNIVRDAFQWLIDYGALEKRSNRHVWTGKIESIREVQKALHLPPIVVREQ